MKQQPAQDPVRTSTLTLLSRIFYYSFQAMYEHPSKMVCRGEIETVFCPFVFMKKIRDWNNHLSCSYLPCLE